VLLYYTTATSVLIDTTGSGLTFYWKATGKRSPARIDCASRYDVAAMRA